jgi:DNA polymerase
VENAIQNPGTVFRYLKTHWKMEGPWLKCLLPSGRVMRYYKPRIEDGQIFYEGMHPTRSLWIRDIKTYGGKIIGNVTQATARDIMAEAMLALDARGYKVILSVHDEPIVEVPEGFGTVEEMENIMCHSSPWAEGCPIAAEGWRGKRYRK